MLLRAHQRLEGRVPAHTRRRLGLGTQGAPILMGLIVGLAMALGPWGESGRCHLCWRAAVWRRGQHVRTTEPALAVARTGASDADGASGRASLEHASAASSRWPAASEAGRSAVTMAPDRGSLGGVSRPGGSAPAEE
jgi:hypothetical protein